MNRNDLITEIATIIASIKRPHVVRVAIDGLMASGKTTFAADLAKQLAKSGANAIQGSVDDFFNDRETRYSRGFDSATGCYQDTEDIEGLKDFLLKPLSLGGNGKVKKAIFDPIINRPIESSWVETKPSDILIFEGLFLQRPELFEYWDLRIFVKANSDVTLSRALVRDLELFNNPNELISKHRKRYIPAQEIYLRDVAPEIKADIVVDNNDYNCPRIVEA